MNEDAFARRFYADRAELDSLGIALTVDKPVDGVAEQESYSLPPENFYLPAIEFTDAELAALQTALSLLDGEFAYAEPLRLALQQISWGRPEPAARPRPALDRASASRPRPAATSSPSAWSRSRPRSPGARRSPSTTTRWSATTLGERKVDPYQLLFQGGQFYLVGHSARASKRSACSASRASAARSPTPRKAEHDFQRARADFDPRAYARPHRLAVRRRRGRRPRCRSAERIAWQVRAPLRPLRALRGRDEGRVFVTAVRQRPPARCLGAAGWASTPGSLGPPSSSTSWPSASSCSSAATTPRLELAAGGRRPARATSAAPTPRRPTATAARDAAIRPERFARLVTLASILIEAGRARAAAADVERGPRAPADLRARSCARTSTSSTSSTSARGSYVLYAEVGADGRSRSTPTPTPTTSRGPRGCCRSRPRRWWRRST